MRFAGMRFQAAVALLSVNAAFPAAPRAGQIRQAAARAIARLQASQKNWYDQQGCASCHHQFLPALAYREAREHGIPLDEKIARADAEQAFAFYSDLDRAVEHAHLVDPGIGDAYSLLAANAAGVRPSTVTAVYARFLEQRQKADGHWNTYDQRPPQSSSVVTATALAVQVLKVYGSASSSVSRIEKAREWLLTHTPRDTEERAFQLLGLAWADEGRADLDARAKEIEHLQQPDGGWAALDGRASDAYSTGEILFALSEAGIPAGAASFSRGIEYLLQTEKPDGTWRVPTRLYPPAPLSPDYFESGYPYGHDQMLSAMGASWAIMALARALPAVKSTALPVLSEAAPPSLPPWIATLLFGSAGEVRRLLDSGFDPNSATGAGTTALMLAAPDVDKLKLLLDRGAKVNARSHDGYSALMFAALYADSTPALRLLLGRGAEIRATDGSPPLFHAYPAALAAIAGNAEGVKLLIDAGDSVNDTYDYAGIEPASPLILLSTFDDVPVMSALLDAGARVDQPDAEGLTALQWAVLANRAEIAELLLDRGADVNHVDQHGMTALLYAASIDFGDSRIVDLLLARGARRDARTPEGLTALDLARKYRHTRLIKSLE